MKIYTSYFWRLKAFDALNLTSNCISIAGYTPDWFKSKKLLKLAPKKDWWNEWSRIFKDDHDSIESRTWYTRKYHETILSKLNPNEVVSELNELCEDVAILMCYETPDKFCHRQLVSKWLNDNGVECSEFVFN